MQRRVPADSAQSTGRRPSAVSTSLAGLGVAALVSIVGAGLMPAVASAAPMGPALHPTAAASCGALATGSSGKAVATLQAALHTSPDGGFGPDTRAALKRWQRRHGLQPTGVVGRATWAALPQRVTWTACGQPVAAVPPQSASKHCAALTKGAVGPAVAVLQHSIGAGVDGGFGPHTAKAVRQAQRAHRLRPTGAVNHTLWHALGLTGTPACEPGKSAPTGGGANSSSGPSTPDARQQARIRSRVAQIVSQLHGRSTAHSQITAAALAFAHSQIGKPYAWGGTGPKSYDCSGLAMAAYDAVAIPIPRTAAAQYQAGLHVPLQDARAGDLVYWASDVTKSATVYHTGIYLGGGQVLDAPHSGENVQIQSIWSVDLMPSVVRPRNELSFPVAPGDTGSTVEALQTALDHHGAQLTVDGGDGPATVAAVETWQSANGYSSTGTVTSAMWAKLGWTPGH